MEMDALHFNQHIILFTAYFMLMRVEELQLQLALEDINSYWKNYYLYVSPASLSNTLCIYMIEASCLTMTLV